MADLCMDVVLLMRAADVKPGDLLVMRSRSRLNSSQIDRLRLDLKGRVPKGVELVLLEGDEFDLRRMEEAERRMMLDRLCASLGMRAVPL